MDNPGNKKSGKGLFTKFLLGFVTIILIVIMFPKGESIEFEVSEGAIWLYDDLIAPFSFPIKKVMKFIAKKSMLQKEVFIRCSWMKAQTNKKVLKR